MCQIALTSLLQNRQIQCAQVGHKIFYLKFLSICVYLELVNGENGREGRTLAG